LIEAKMPRISQEAEMIARYAGEMPKPEPPAELTEEQKRYWREICEDLAQGHLRSEGEPTMIELVRQMSYATQISEQLNSLRQLELTGSDKAGKSQRAIFTRLLQASREQSHIIAVLSTKLRFTNQSRVNSVTAERARARTPTGRRPWEFPFADDEPEPQAS
jgi:hypothetical protein